MYVYRVSEKFPIHFYKMIEMHIDSTEGGRINFARVQDCKKKTRSFAIKNRGRSNEVYIPHWAEAIMNVFTKVDLIHD